MELPILADVGTARVIRDIIDATGDESGNGTRPSRRPYDHALVVKLLANITAGSTAQVDAEIYELVSGNWQGTKQTIKVRSVTGAAVSTTGRRIARRVSRWGWCVVET
jgi:hypothetical protein